MEKKPIPITSTKMTRFFLRMQDAVELCNYAISNMLGGEIFVPKIPSYKVTDLAKAICSKTKIKIIVKNFKNSIFNFEKNVKYKIKHYFVY